MDTVRNNRLAWESASEKHVREYDDLLHQATDHSSLLDRELDLLRPLLAPAPAVVHLMSGHGLDDVAFVSAGARSVVGVDFSVVAATGAQISAPLPVYTRSAQASHSGAPGSSATR